MDFFIKFIYDISAVLQLSARRSALLSEQGGVSPLIQYLQHLFSRRCSFSQTALKAWSDPIVPIHLAFAQKNQRVQSCRLATHHNTQKTRHGRYAIFVHSLHTQSLAVRVLATSLPAFLLLLRTETPPRTVVRGRHAIDRRNQHARAQSSHRPPLPSISRLLQHIVGKKILYDCIRDVPQRSLGRGVGGSNWRARSRTQTQTKAAESACSASERKRCKLTELTDK